MKETAREVVAAGLYRERSAGREKEEDINATRRRIEELKAGSSMAAAWLAKRLARQLEGAFGALVPVPSSRPGRAGGSVVLTRALEQAGCGHMYNAVERTEAIVSSSRQRGRGCKGPTVEEHLDTLAPCMEGIVTASQRLWLVDDVLTTGNTLRAVAKVLGVEGSCGWIVAVVATYSPAEERLWAEEREGLFNEVRKGLDAAGGRQKD